MTGDTWSIRDGTVADAAAVLALWRAAETAPSVTDDLEALELLLNTSPSALLVAEVEARIVASLIATFDGWRGNLYRLAVHPAHRRLGIASAILAAGEARLEARGVRKITALVAHRQEGAVEFWQRVGYRPDPITARHAKTFGPGAPSAPPARPA